MSGTKSKTIFRRSKVGFEASDPSGWNDLAIIKAYDSAIATDLIMDDFEDDSPKVGDVVWKRNQGVIEKQSSESAAKATGASKKAKKRKRKNGEVTDKLNKFSFLRILVQLFAKVLNYSTS